jgi:succinoglycan biosynthesis transport protein ExoP
MSDDASLPVVRRRRWPRIIGFLFLVALVSGAIAWLVWPKTVTATALFEVRQGEETLTGYPRVQMHSEGEFEILKKTQIALLKSKFLLTSALRDPGVASLSVFAGVRNPEEWLQDHVNVSFPENGEVLAISLSGPESQAHDLSVIVDAVAGAYNKEVIGKEKSRRLNVRDMMERTLQNLNGDIKRKLEDYLDIAKGMDKPTGEKDFRTQLDLKRMDRIDEELAQLDRDKLKMEISSNSKDSKFVDARIEQLKKRQNELEKTIQKRHERSVDLETRGEELKQLQLIANEMNVNLEKLDIDNQLPAQIHQVQSAVIDDGKIARR